MKANINIKANKSYSSEAEIREAVEKSLEYHKVVSADDVPDYNPESEECIFSHTLSVWDEEHQGEVLYDVRIYAYYIGGPDYDYIYTYTII